MLKTTSLLLSVLLILISSVGCSSNKSSSASSAQVDAEAIKAALATEVVATITAEAKNAASSAPLLDSTSTPADTHTPVETPQPTPTPIQTREPTSTPTRRPTSTPRPTAAPTTMPGIGDTVRCANLWQIGAISVPDLSGIVTSDPPKGAYAKVYFKLKNLQSETDYLSYISDDLQLVGTISGQSLAFDATSLGPSINDKNRGVSAWNDDIPPLIEATVGAIFDINPAATDWRLRLTISQISGTDCQAEIALYDTGLAQVIESAQSGESIGVIGLVNRASVNLRAGPDTNYAVAGQGQQGQQFIIGGTNAAGDWYQVCCISGQNAWIAGFLLDITGDLTTVPVSTDIPPMPVAAATPTPLSYNTGIGAPEVQVQNWGLRLYDVKKAKTVYFFSSGEFAAGVWLIPFVEFRNLGSGTDEPQDSLDIYLQDSLGRTFTFNPFNDGVLGAAWQFQAGHLYDDINPGSVLGIALPIDVAPDLGDIWLRVQQNPSIAIYLGNVSQLPQEN